PAARPAEKTQEIVIALVHWRGVLPVRHVGSRSRRRRLLRACVLVAREARAACPIFLVRCLTHETLLDLSLEINLPRRQRASRDSRVLIRIRVGGGRWREIDRDRTIRAAEDGRQRERMARREM